MDQRIINFLQNNEILSFAMQDRNEVYIANAFYIFDILHSSFIIASDKNTKHVKLSIINPCIAVNVYQGKKIALLKGVQIKAKFIDATKEQEKLYYHKFPFVKFQKDIKIYALCILWAKFTDNTLMLNQKIEFQRN
ncbi:hypothetical protein JG676_07155 [Campylobacter sp. 2018MI35]|uniref:hypothetical protein n=1 Tax=Campylobacter sp. 2018MI34 TaxID=2800582 RepID=UPI001903892D|nr:hypothetical protein [Campylobacter sp. 2018MI34]MBK1992370.1 hypothetical protein [Campylobacter sp. 2018MI34]